MRCGGLKLQKGTAMTRTEMIAIRRRLRAVNIEYSGLVRTKLGESRFVRMEALKAEREALVGLIVESEKRRLRTLTAVLPEAALSSVQAGAGG
jgi:hypothetical protein